jgi:hypothetical protein
VSFNICVSNFAKPRWVNLKKTNSDYYEIKYRDKTNYENININIIIDELLTLIHNSAYNNQILHFILGALRHNNISSINLNQDENSYTFYWIGCCGTDINPHISMDKVINQVVIMLNNKKLMSTALLALQDSKLNIPQSVYDITSANFVERIDEILKITFNSIPPIKAIIKTESDYGGFGISVANTKEDLCKIIMKAKPNVNFLVSQYIESAYIDWKDYTFINKYEYSVTTQFNKKKANIRPYFLILIDSKEIFVYLWKDFTLMAAMDIYDSADISNRKAHITNISCHSDYFSKSIIPQIMTDKNITDLNIAKYTGYQQFQGLIKPPSPITTNNPVENGLYKIIREQIIALIIANIKCIENKIKCKDNNKTPYCHHVFCMDTHLDENKKLWYIETNTNCGVLNLDVAYYTTKERESIYYDLLSRVIPSSFNYENGWELIYNSKVKSSITEIPIPRSNID